MTKKRALIATSFLFVIALLALGVYRFTPLKVSEEAKSAAIKSLNFKNLTVGEASQYLCSDGENGYYFRDSEKPKIIKVSNNKILRELNCEKIQGDADRIRINSAYITDGEIYFTVSLFYGIDETNVIYKAYTNLLSCELTAENYKLGDITSYGFVVDGGVIYYTLQSGEKYKIASRRGYEEKIIYESDNVIEALMIEDNCLFVRDCDKEKLYRIDLETKKIKKLPFVTVQKSNIKFSNIADIDFVDENKRIMAVYLKLYDSSYDLGDEDVVYFFDVKTGRKCKMK